MIAWLKTLFNATTEQVDGALVMALATAVLTLFGWLLLRGYDAYLAWRAAQRQKLDRQRHLREVIVDILIHADFDRQSVEGITDPQAIAALKKQIDQAPDSYRPFIAFEPEDPTFADYRGIRRKLNLELMVACDRFFDNSMLFHRYYEKLASDEFVALSPERKKGALNRLCAIGQEVLGDNRTLVAAMRSSPVAKAHLVDVQELLKDERSEPPAETAETGHTIGGSGP